jgi:hypothetical protein
MRVCASRAFPRVAASCIPVRPGATEVAGFHVRISQTRGYSAFVLHSQVEIAPLCRPTPRLGWCPTGGCPLFYGCRRDRALRWLVLTRHGHTGLRRSQGKGRIAHAEEDDGAEGGLGSLEGAKRRPHFEEVQDRRRICTVPSREEEDAVAAAYPSNEGVVRGAFVYLRPGSFQTCRASATASASTRRIHASWRPAALCSRSWTKSRAWHSFSCSSTCFLQVFQPWLTPF